MKKYLHPKLLPLLLPLTGVLGYALRLWTLGKGPDKGGLYEPQPLAWALVWIVTALTAVLVFLLTRQLKASGKFSDHFASSLPGAIGCGMAAVGIAFGGFHALGNWTLSVSIFTGFITVLAAGCMILAAVGRFNGERTAFWVYAIPCLFFAMRIFDRCRGWSEHTQTGLFVCQLLASACIMLAFYQRVCFDVDLGSRRQSLFWSSMAIYTSFLALADKKELVFYLCMIIFLATNMCSLRPLGKKPASEDETEILPDPSFSTEADM